MDKTNVNNNWSRLEQVIRWSGMTTNYFAHHIGLTRAENLYQIKSGKNGISRNLASRIVKVFPEISIGWLMAGDGDMFAAQEGACKIPYFEGDSAWQSLFGELQLGHSTTLLLPMLGQCDCALRCQDEAMSKDVAPGSVVFLRQIDLNMVISGGLYVVVCSNFVLLRRVKVMQGDAGEMLFKLETANKNFDTIIVPSDNVMKVYKLVGSLKPY